MAMIDSTEARAALCGLPQSTDGMVPLSAALRVLSALAPAETVEVPRPRTEMAPHLIGARVPGL